MPPSDLETPTDFFHRLPGFTATPLVELPLLAKHCRVAKVHLKDESRRLLGSFKSLGGMYAGLRALARATGSLSIESLIAAKLPASKLPALICASDGNHGLAVAAAAEMVGARARVFLPKHVSGQRARRIAARGSELVWIDGTYDNAVDAAMRAAEHDAGLLIADTSTDEHDPVVADVMAGYGLLAQEILAQLSSQGAERLTHLFVQAGVGGLAAAMARGLSAPASAACRIVVVEPENAACVGLALKLGRIERLSGDLTTSAEMLSCGEASAPALKILRACRAESLAVSEDALADAVRLLPTFGGPETTPSGATGLAGFLSALPGSSLAQQFGVDEQSRILLMVTEGRVPPE